jgi:hypothetical protein
VRCKHIAKVSLYSQNSKKKKKKKEKKKQILHPSEPCNMKMLKPAMILFRNANVGLKLEEIRNLS